MEGVQGGWTDPPIGDLGEQLALAGGDGRYHRDAEGYWGFAGRLFGGYSAALALAAAAREARGLDPLSIWCRFLEPVRAGRVDLVVELLQAGRTTAAHRTTIVQEDRPMLTLDGWFGTRPTDAIGPPPELNDAPGPDDCPPIQWRVEKNRFDVSFARRGIDYPVVRSDFVGRHRPVELWLRPEPPGEQGPGVAAAVDVMIFDLHMTEGLVEQPGFSNAKSFSYDLAVWWHDTAPTGWRRLRVEASAHGRAGSCEASMWTREGRSRAGAAQQVKLGRAG